jgi:pimeloyl-ACP methyl ester carboxylesterase
MASPWLFRRALLLPLVLISNSLPLVWAQAPAGGGGPRQSEAPMKGESRLISRGDVELLTYETEADVQKLDDLFTANQAAVPKPGEYGMNYLRSRTDGSVQPYGLWVPPGYAPDRKFALLVQLHGIGPKALAGRRLSWRGMGVREWVDPYAPVLVASVYGRGNTFYQGMGEEDVLEVIADVQRRYAIDADRIFIMGHSMGGAGSWLVGLRHPDQFGSVTPIDAAMGSGNGVDVPADSSDWMQPQIALFRPDNLFPNARNVPVFMKNAGAGIQKTSTHFSDGVVAAGGFATMESFPGMPHHWAPIMSYSIFTGAATLQPINRRPAEVKFFTNTLRYDRAYWVTLDRLTRHNADARVTAIFDDGKPHQPPGGGRGQPQREPEPARAPTLTVTTENIDALTLRLGEAGVPADVPVALTVDGAEVSSGPLPAIAHLVQSDGKWQLASEAAHSGKHHGMQGPIGDAFNSRFLAVYGDGDLPLARAELDAIRNPPSMLMIHGEFPLKAAAKVTAEDIAGSNLILFGTAKSNPLIGRLTPKLPAPLMASAGEGSAVVFIHPNPENPARYVVVWTGPVLSTKLDVPLKAGWMMPVNLLPDYFVVREGKVVRAGHFDRDWK